MVLIQLSVCCNTELMCTGWVLGLTSEQMSKGLSSTPITPDTAAKAKISLLKYVYMEKHIVGVSM